MSSMITTTAWVRRGVAAQFPTKYEIDEEEMGRISKLARMQLEEAQDDLSAAKAGKMDDGEDDSAMEEDNKEADAMDEESEKKPSKEGDDTKSTDDDDVLKEFDMDHYDSDDIDEDGEKVTRFGNVQSLAYHQPNEADPYLVIPEDEEDEDREELQILPTDNLLLAGKVEDEVAHLEVYVYEDRADNLYVHHDIMLPGIPLCVEWLDIPVGKGSEDRKTGNFVAIGTMEPDIEIWDLDVVDSMYPNAILGQGGQDAGDGAQAKKKSKKKKSKANDEYHIDAVLALAANRQHRNLLASASADRTVKLWDLNTTSCAKSYSHHTDKLTCVPPDSTARWGVDTDVESVRWDPHDPNYFYVTTDGGMVYRFDIRNVPATPAESKPAWSLQAHDSSVSSFDINRTIPGFLVTGSTDKEVKLWNVENDKPSLVVTRKLDVGKVFSTAFAPDAEVSFRLAVAGSKGTVQIWDASTNGAVRRAFVSRMPDLAGDVPERLIGVGADDEESDDEGAEEGGETGQADGPDGWESMDED
ncbi:WD repeat-containing protein [Penicillium canariense]|uniref:WD repeat-containing protein n=1 Tax=Penicillium canariense TaxID=189055 RepID=A0A9W9I665_9EURO|nr:WD repeat-containing protein [Penicillium canariense]KAJ5167746.1 WD repeat-containing protein [Penicillium canariense]